MNTAFRLLFILIFSVTSTANYAAVPPAGAPALDSAPVQAEQLPTGGFSRLFALNPPEANLDEYFMDEDGVLVVDAPGVLENDNEPDAEEMTAVQKSSPLNGELLFEADGSFTYTPDPDFYGNDSFTYAASDGDFESNIVTVTITINEVNDVPVAVEDEYTVNEDATLTVTGANSVLANDSDVETAELSASVVDYPTSGSLVFEDNDGTFTYEPDPNFFGTDTFTYQAFDGVDVSAITSVTLNVLPLNDRPVSQADTYSTNEDTPLEVTEPGVLENDEDVDDDPLSAALDNGPSAGQLTLNTDGSFLYTPATNFSGDVTFTYTAGDGLLNSTASTVTIHVNAVNDAPVAVNDSYTMLEDATLSVPVGTGILNNDTDVEGNALSAVLVTGPSHGTLNLSANGSFIYAPVQNYAASDSFTYRANDGNLASANVGTVTITVNNVNDRPVANNDTYSATEDTQLTVDLPGVLANDTDVEGSALTAVQPTNPSRGTLTLQPDGSFVYTPSTNLNGADTFTYYARDGAENSVTPATVTINVGAVNDAPVAAADVFNAVEDTALVVSAATGVLQNDTDIDGPALTAQLVNGPAHGSLLWNGDGSFTYTPAGNYSGDDSFTYRASDGSLQSATVTAQIHIAAVNDRPVANNDSYTTPEDTALTITAPGVLANDTDADGDQLSAVSFTQPTHGTLNSNANGSFTYTPAANFNGADSFTYIARDAAENSLVTATVNLNITAQNDRPVANDDTYYTAEDSSLIVVEDSVMDNDNDVEGTALQAALANPTTHGSITLYENGTFNYTPNANFFGTDTFTYTVTDGGLVSEEATVNINVTAVNDRPVASANTFSTAEDTPLTVAAPGVLAGDTDVDGDQLTASIGTLPTQGLLTLNSNGSFTYNPPGNFHGEITFTYFASDPVISSADPATVTIEVTAVNDRPTAASDEFTTAEDTPLNQTAVTVLDNDADIDGDALTAQLVAQPQNGSVTLNPNGTFTYTPNANFQGPDTFTYNCYDGVLTSQPPAGVTINVTPVNDRPVPVNDTAQVNEDGVLTVSGTGVLANDIDADGDSLNCVVAENPQHGTLDLHSDGSYTYTPAANYHGPDQFTYYTNDSVSTSATAGEVSIDVISVNDLPVTADDAYITDEDTPLTVPAPGVLNNDTDLDGDPLTAELALGPAHGTLALNPNGSFTYTPEANFEGEDTFTYHANDTQNNSALTAQVTITVEAQNDAPTAADDAFSTDEDTPLTVAANGVLGNDNDVDGDAITAVLQGNPQHGTLTLNTNGGFTYTPNANYNGPDSFTYFANDGTLNSALPATVNLTVNAVNDAPVAVADTYSTPEDTPLVVTAPGVLNNDTDIDSTGLTAVLSAGPAHGSLALNSDGSFTYTPSLNYTGPDSFTYRASDGDLQSALPAVTVSLEVTDVNDVPVAVNNTYSTAEDTPLTVTAPGPLANDTDVENDALNAALVDGPDHGTLTLLPSGEFTYTPASNFNGDDSFTYTAVDAGGASEPATVTINVTPVNDAPVGTTDSYPAFDEDTTLTVAVGSSVLNNDNDIDSTGLTAVVYDAPDHGTLTLNANGSFTYTPSANYNGPDSFQYRAYDTELYSQPVTVNLTINPVNDAPVANAGTLTVAEDTPGAITMTGTDIETPASLTFAVVNAPLHGTLSGTQPNLTYTPALNYFGSDSFTFRATDPGLLNSAPVTISITITAVNDAPLAVADPAYTTAEDTPLTITAPGVLNNDSDVDNTTLHAVISGAPAHGTLTLNDNGSFTYTPSLNYNGVDTFRYFANDGQVNSPDVAIATINVTAVNDAPVAVTESYTTAEDTPLNLAASGGVSVLTNDSDVDGDSLNAVLVANAGHGTVTMPANGLFTYTPAANYFGPDSFTYRASDGGAQSNIVTVNLTVTPVNDAPRTYSKFYSVAVDGVLIVPASSPLGDPPGLLQDAADIENNAFTAQIVTPPIYGELIANPDGSFTYNASHMYSYDDEFTFRACETVSGLCGSPSTVEIDIVNPDTGIQVQWIAPVRSGNWRVGNEEITLHVHITNCADCGVRFYRWDAVAGDYVDIATVFATDATYVIPSSILNAGWGLDGWNQILANAVLPNGTKSSPRRYIFVIRLPYERAATRIFIPLGSKD
ncbi:MAG TPA: Ig-like domain-containing protein [Anaerolineaceae bacterium]